LLNDDGLLLFSIELGNDKDYQLQSSGRYIHNLVYIEHIAQQLNFKVLAAKQVIGRYQQDEAVNSMIFVLQR
jgi:predicted TPR repeat methyltransferase